MLTSGVDPTLSPPADLERFRQQVMAMHSDLLIEEQIGRRLSEIYKRALE
jgi:hypothetical protein